MKSLGQGVIPEIGSKWTHHSGRVYRVIIIANENTGRPKQYPVTVVYENVDNGTVWSRPSADWDRSFAPIGKGAKSNDH